MMLIIFYGVFWHLYVFGEMSRSAHFLIGLFVFLNMEFNELFIYFGD